jgi:hypothetical protein
MMMIIIIVVDVDVYEVVSIAPTDAVAARFTSNERKEQRKAWHSIRALKECWSGAMAEYAVKSDGRMELRDAKPARNFRLRIRTRGSTGTWTVWNLNQVGEEIVIPLFQTPPSRPTQLKFGFRAVAADVVVIVRVPEALNLSRTVFEIGFWDRSTRRTAVAEYKRTKRSLPFLLRPASMHLDEVSLVQMKSESPRSFVGNTTDKEAIKALPVESPWSDITDWKLETMQAISSETVDVATMERTREVRLSSERRQQVYDHVIERLVKRDTTRTTFIRAVLPNGICMCVPERLPCIEKSSGRETLQAEGQKCSTLPFLFGSMKENRLQVLELQYRPNTWQAGHVALHTFRRMGSRN